MNDKTQDAVVTTAQINYQFTAIPTNLFFALDNNCRSMLATLTQLSTYYADDCGWFFRTYQDLEAQTRMSQNLVKATLQTLFNHNIIDVKGVGKSKGKHPNYYKINFNEFKKFESLKLEDIVKNPNFQINTVSYKGSNFKVNFTKEMVKSDNNTVIETVDNTVNNTVNKTVKSDNNINNIDNINNINDNSNNVINVEETSTFDKVEDNEHFDNITFSYSNLLNDDNTVSTVEVIKSDTNNTNALQIEVKEANTNNTLQDDNTSNISKQERITSIYKKIDDFNNRLYNATNRETVAYLNEKMTQLLQKCLDNSGMFSDKQWDLLIQKMNHFESLRESKIKYFNGYQKTLTAEEEHNQMMMEFSTRF